MDERELRELKRSMQTMEHNNMHLLEEVQALEKKVRDLQRSYYAVLIIIAALYITHLVFDHIIW